jgi:hypothetical protein
VLTGAPPRPVAGAPVSTTKRTQHRASTRCCVRNAVLWRGAGRYDTRGRTAVARRSARAAAAAGVSATVSM